jgi:hypothetical protein
MTQEKAQQQHTPGPWSIDCNLGVFPEDGMPITDDKTDNEVCVVWPQSDDNAQAANARLIAAAPDLLAALDYHARLIAATPDLLAALDYLLEQTVDMDLKHGIELTEGETEAREQALAAIKKATNQNP